jgi:hypothetical protein
MGRPECRRPPLTPRGTYGRRRVGQAGYERDTGSHVSIAPLLFLYCFSIVPLVLGVFSASTPGDSALLTPMLSRLALGFACLLRPRPAHS